MLVLKNKETQTLIKSVHNDIITSTPNTTRTINTIKLEDSSKYKISTINPFTMNASAIQSDNLLLYTKDTRKYYKTKRTIEVLTIRHNNKSMSFRNDLTEVKDFGIMCIHNLLVVSNLDVGTEEEMMFQLLLDPNFKTNFNNTEVLQFLKIYKEFNSIIQEQENKL